MTEKSVIVKNDAGIHCRPSSEIMMVVQQYSGCSFHLTTNSGDSDMSSILSLIGLGLAKGDPVTLKVEGANEQEACEKVADLFEYEFDFPQK
ncbi:MAG: HPr family phosphocarrier protein [Victivallales bacterium]|nr:HPr family phosphocarrier protein [Victivallales bacterium]